MCSLYNYLCFCVLCCILCIEYSSFISILGHQVQKQQWYNWYLLLKMILQFYHSPPPLPPPVWYWSWNSNTLATWWEKLTHWKRPWCWERLGAGEGDDRRWDGWMASPTQRTWAWVNSGSWWWAWKPGVLQFIGSQKVGHDWGTELNLGYQVQKQQWHRWYLLLKTSLQFYHFPLPLPPPVSNCSGVPAIVLYHHTFQSNSTVRFKVSPLFVVCSLCIISVISIANVLQYSTI